MVSTFTPNIQLEEPARGDDVGTWDTPVNNNMTLLDLVCGSITSISLNNSNVTLSAPQFQSKQLTFVSTLTGSVTITFPTSFKKSYEIQNLCSGSSSFTITLATTAGGQVICAPPGEIVDVVNDGSNLKYKNLGRIGSYMDWAGGSNVPTWVSGCSIPPYLDCNGQAFSSAVYPVLATILGQTTVPDFRGRAPFYLNEGTGRLTTAGAGINGDASFAVGGNNGVALGSSQIPNINCQGNNSIVVQSQNGQVGIPTAPTAANISGAFANGTGGTISVPSNTAASWGAVSQLSGNNNISVNSVGTGGGIVPATIPGCVSGFRLIRAG